MKRRISRHDSTEMSSTDTPANVIHEAAGPHQRLRLILREPRALALAWLAGYLVLSGALLGVGGHGRLAVMHVALIVVAGWSVVPRNDLARTVGDLLPLFAAPLLYGEIPFLIAVFSGGP